MSPAALSRYLSLAISLALVVAQGTTTSPPASSPTPSPVPTSPPPPTTPAGVSTYPAVPLASKGPFIYPSGIPYKVDTDLNLIRGTQVGYNICNSTTEGQSSLCQTSWLNSLDDFCLWAPPEYGREVGDIEGNMIAWCSKPGHGTRLIPSGALTGVQLTKTPDYIQVVGFIDQTKINMLDGDYGGEMDPHGADLRGNPMGGILFSSSFTGQPIQGMEWHNFMGSNKFCLKVCDPRGANDARYCEHIFDRIGCDYNAPNNARNSVFESCDGESQDFPGVYTSNGVAQTYTQPAVSLGPITTIPYVARVPASSNCRTFESSAIFTGLPSVSVSSTTRVSTSKASGAGTGTSGAANPTGSSGANELKVSGAVVLAGVLVSAVFLS